MNFTLYILLLAAITPLRTPKDGNNPQSVEMASLNPNQTVIRHTIVLPFIDRTLAWNGLTNATQYLVCVGTNRDENAWVVSTSSTNATVRIPVPNDYAGFLYYRVEILFPGGIQLTEILREPDWPINAAEIDCNQSVNLQRSDDLLSWYDFAQAVQFPLTVYQLGFYRGEGAAVPISIKGLRLWNKDHFGGNG